MAVQMVLMTEVNYVNNQSLVLRSRKSVMLIRISKYIFA